MAKAEITDCTPTQVVPLAYIAGYALLPRQLRQERAAAYTPISESTHDERAQTDRLLAEED